MADGRRSLSTALIGRTRELTRTFSFLEQADAGGAVLIVTGDPGIGKSAILTVTTQAAAAVGATILEATGVEVEVDVGFAGLHQLLDPCRGHFDELGARHRDALEVCLGLKEGPPPLRPAVATATLTLLSHLSAEQPLLVVVDDLQWLDRPSAEVLTTVVRHLTGIRVGFLGALRSGEEAFFDRGTLPELPLHTLPRGDAATLLAKRAPTMAAATKAHVLELAAGNPLALLELPLQSPLLDHLGAPGGSLPVRLKALFAPRIRALPSAARHLLLLAALDTSGDLGVISTAAGAAPEDDTVRLCEQRRLISVDRRAGTLELRHPLIRSSAVALASGAERRRAHRALGGVEHSRLERRAKHLADASLGPDDTVARMLETSGRLLLRRGDAGGAVSMLLRAADMSGQARERARRLAHAAYIGADLTGDLNRVSALLAEAHRGLPERRGSIDTAMAAAYLLLNGDGDVVTAHRLLVGALRAGDADAAIDEVTLTEALHTLLMICFCGARADLWEPFFAEIKRLEPDVPSVLAISAQTFAAPATSGVQALPDLRAAVAATQWEEDPMQIVRTAIAAFYPHQLDGCLPALWRVVREGIDQGAVTSAINAWMLLAFHAFFAGRWDDADAYARRGLELSEPRGYQVLAWPGRYCLALLAAARGQDDVSDGLSDEMLRWAQPRGVRSTMAYAHHSATVAALGRCDFETAYRHASAVSRPGLIDPYLAHALWLTVDMVEAAVHTNRHEQALAHVEAMRAADMGALSSRYALMLAAAEAMVAPGGPAMSLFDSALATPDAQRWPFDLGRVHLAYGERLRRARQYTQARAQLTSALEIFQLLAAAPWVSRVMSQLQAISGVREPAGAPVTRLTSRELEVATLAASGLTNGQIAARLGTSPRTVGTHLSHVFDKLVVSSRAGLPDALAGRGVHST